MISGTVLDEEGHPLQGARVFLTEAPVPIPDIAALSDAEGRFALAAPAPGSYTVECAAEDARTASRTVDVAPDGAEITLRISRRR